MIIILSIIIVIVLISIFLNQNKDSDNLSKKNCIYYELCDLWIVFCIWWALFWSAMIKKRKCYKFLVILIKYRSRNSFFLLGVIISFFCSICYLYRYIYICNYMYSVKISLFNIIMFFRNYFRSCLTSIIHMGVFRRSCVHGL